MPIKLRVNTLTFDLNNLVNELIKDYPFIHNTAISYYSSVDNVFVYCGIFPNEYEIFLPINLINPIVNSIIYYH